MRAYDTQEERTGFRWAPVSSWVKFFLIWYGVVFGIETILNFIPSVGSGVISNYTRMIPAEVWDNPLHAYRLFAYLLVPPWEIWTFCVNLLSIYFFGSFLEGQLGSKRFLGLFLFSGLFASLGYLLITRAGGVAPLEGPGAACFGLLATAAVLYPQMEVIFLIFPMRMWALAGLVALFEAFALLSSRQPSAWANLLGLAGGGLFAWNLSAVVPVWQRIWPKATVEKWKQARVKNQKKKESLDRAEMDRILEKISQSGIGSLTSTEKKFLEKSSQRLRHHP